MRIIFYLFLCLPSLLAAQGYTYKLYTKKDGLADDVISHICQDGKGYLWLRTDKGFSSFDGINFRNYIDKSIDVNWDWDYDNVSSLKGGGIVYLAGPGYRRLPDKSDNSDVDSSLLFRKGQYELDRRQNFLDKDGYRLFSFIKNPNNRVFSDTLYYQLNGEVSFCLLPKQYDRNNWYTIRGTRRYGWKNEFPTAFLVRDFQNNVYIRGFDSIRLKSDFFLFDKGKVIKLFSADSISIDVKLVKTYDGHYWLINQFDNTLMAECYDFKGRIIRTFYKKDFFTSDYLNDYSKLIPDSKNQVWFSGPKGLVKISMNGIELFEDNRRFIPKLSKIYYNESGKENYIYESDYSNFSHAFAINKSDYIITGERIFDKVEFATICQDLEFLKHFTYPNRTSIRYCFVDREQNIWLSLTSGLLKLSPAPFKAVEARYSSEYPDHNLSYVDRKGRKYYSYSNFAQNKVDLFVVEEENVEKLEIKTAKANLQINFEACGNAVVLTYMDQANRSTTLLYPSNTKFTCKVGEGIKLRLKKRDTLYYAGANPSNDRYFLLTTTAQNFKSQNISKEMYESLSYSISPTFVNLYENGRYLYSKNLQTFQINKDGSIDTVLFIPRSFASFPSCVYYERRNKSLFIINGNYEFLRIKDAKLQKLILKNINEFKTLKSVSKLVDTNNEIFYTQALEIGELLVFRVDQNLYVFKVEGNSLTFIRHLDFDSVDYLNYNMIYSLYADNKKVSFYTEEKGVYIISYENFSNGQFNSMMHLNVECNLSGEIVQTEEGTTRIGNTISYLGRKGHNTLLPQFVGFDVTYAESDGVKNLMPENGDKIVKEYNKDNFFIEWQAICLTDGPQVRYKYKLIGFEEDWNLNKNRAVNYPNLPPGSYTFQVFASNNEGLWTNGEHYFLLTVLKPCYTTWWAFTIYFILLVFLVLFFIRYRLRRLREENEKLEQTVLLRTKEVTQQKIIIEEKHREIIDSINYAERIQRSFLATRNVLDTNLKDYFVFYRPKEAVSGDFYWAEKLNDGNFALVTADSTGHGVPGAIMSILNITSLESAIREGFTEANQILNHTRTQIISRLKLDGSEEGGKDGMDCSLIILDQDKTKMKYAGAQNPVWVVRNQVLLELEPDRMPVGKHEKDQISFSQLEFSLKTGDVIYALTDGYPDQFGGPKGKKYMYKRLKELLISIANKTMQEQEEMLKQTLATWKGSSEQVDDITIIGIKV